ncbi:MAG: helix-turn-helix domain-containing protein [Gammaproteobacteria bacterium]
MTFEGDSAAQEASSTTKKTSTSDQQTLRDCLCAHLQAYFDELEGDVPGGLYELVISEVEAPLFDHVLRHTHGNVSLAADLLGIHRSTLRRKLVRHGLI